MADLYEYLISGTPEQAQLPAIVEQLRRRRAMGELGALTGDKVLSPFGQNMSQQADSYAGQLQDIRQKDADNAQTKSYQDSQVAHQEAVLKATLARDAANREHQARADRAAQLRAEAAMERARRAPTSATKPLTAQAINDINSLRQQSDKVASLKSTFKDEYARKGVPGGRTLTNVLARTAPILVSKEDQAAAEWWRTFQMDFNILARNQMFGATLSANEKASWDKAVLGEEMTSDQIKTILNTMDRWYKKDLIDKASLYAGSYNPDQVAKGAGLSRDELDLPSGGPTDEDVEDFFSVYDQDPEAAVAAWDEAFPGVINPADQPAQ